LQKYIDRKTMLELKDVSISRGGKRLFGQLSLIVRDGEMVHIACDAGVGNVLLMAILGLLPKDEGYITVDGELLTTDSAEPFRMMMAYVPQQLVLPAYDNVSDLIKGLFAMKANRHVKFVKSALMELWGSIGLDAALYEKKMTDVDDKLLRIIILSVVLMLKKPIVLVECPQSETEVRLLRKMAEQSSLVVVTGKEAAVDGIYNKQITLNTEI
jgi:ABC-type iron transport system FetAB ATPase subunit